MSIAMTCACGRQFEIPVSYAGCLVRCKNCKRDLIAPKAKGFDEDVMFLSEPAPSATSDKAMASLVLGLCFFLAFFTGIPAIFYGNRALGEIRKSGGRLKGRGMAIGGIILGVIGCLFTIAYLMPATRMARESARRAQCTSNLKQIALAIHNFHQANGCLPAAAITDKNGRPLLSWRVAILPYFDGQSGPSKFHLDEPWDSPHNLTLLDQMPTIYACPSDPSQHPGTTGYQVIVGKETAFTPDFKPLTFADIQDGLSNTLLVAESRSYVPWTKPEDISFDTALLRYGLGSNHGYHDNGFNLLLADGSVKFAKKSITLFVIRAILTRSGEEVIPGNHTWY